MRWSISTPRLPGCSRYCQDGDVVVLTADHGCDPTWNGTDHPVNTSPGALLRQASQGPVPSAVARPFADIGQSIAAYHGLPKLQYGTSFRNLTRPPLRRRAIL